MLRILNETIRKNFWLALKQFTLCKKLSIAKMSWKTITLFLIKEPEKLSHNVKKYT